MENKNESNGFQFTYSASEQEELRRIREKYSGRQEMDKMTRLRRLDHSATQAAQAVSLIFGVIGTLLLGFGMSLFMTDLSKILGSHSDMAMLWGIIIGIVGIVLVILAYPMYNIVLHRIRKRIAPEIIRLTDELMK